MPPATSHWPVETALAAWAIAGSIDLAAATTFSAIRGTGPKRVLQAIASALIGPKAFERPAFAMLGLALHFLIALTVASVYVGASLYLHALDQHPFVSGPLYGISVHLVMTFIVLPLSRLKRPFSAIFFSVQFLIHAFCVGLPIALVTRYFANLA